MDMRPFTDDEFNGPKQLLQIMLTSDADWVPSSIDYEYDKDEWFDTMKDIPEIATGHPFDDYGEYIHRHELDVSCTTIINNHNMQDTLHLNPMEQIESAMEMYQTTPTPIQYDKYQPCFGWLPTDTIKIIAIA